MGTIRTKAEMLSLQQSGKLGNYLKTYPFEYLDLLSTARPDSWFTIQSRERDSPHFIPAVLGQGLPSASSGLIAAGQSPSLIYIRDIPHPESLRIIQGELCLTPQGLYFSGDLSVFHSVRDTMRAPSKTAEGLTALILLSTFMNPSELEDLQSLLISYPDATIEFSLFSKPTGVFNSRLICWEVRDY